MLKKIAQTSAILLALSVLAVPATQVHAQSVTGTDPMPTGGDSDVTAMSVALILMGALSSV
jgi:hypothetical protein